MPVAAGRCSETSAARAVPLFVVKCLVALQAPLARAVCW